MNCYFEKKLASVCFCGNTAEYGIHVAEVALLVPVQTSVRFWKNLWWPFPWRVVDCFCQMKSKIFAFCRVFLCLFCLQVLSITRQENFATFSLQRTCLTCSVYGTRRIFCSSVFQSVRCTEELCVDQWHQGIPKKLLQSPAMTELSLNHFQTLASKRAVRHWFQNNHVHGSLVTAVKSGSGTPIVWQQRGVDAIYIGNDFCVPKRKSIVVCQLLLFRAQYQDVKLEKPGNSAGCKSGYFFHFLIGSLLRRQNWKSFMWGTKKAFAHPVQSTHTAVASSGVFFLHTWFGRTAVLFLSTSCS